MSFINVHYSESGWTQLTEATKDCSSLFVICDTNTKKLCYPIVKNSLQAHQLIVIPAGESIKNLDTVNKVWNALTKAEADRHALIINLGGGVVTDLGGFAASVFKRGVNFIHIPTTLLGMVDAAIGGKHGVNFQNIKNNLGVFQHPKLIVIDPVFLKTLPEREWMSGYAEILKYALIADRKLWNYLITRKPIEIDLEKVIKRCVKIKSKIVKLDPKEKGIRKILNFGHTIGHAMESLFMTKGKCSLLHGEAIAQGMVEEAKEAMEKKSLSIQDFKSVQKFIHQHYPPIKLTSAERKGLNTYLVQDKKNQSGKINTILLTGIGSCKF